jgi:hypothetical protein
VREKELAAATSSILREAKRRLEEAERDVTRAGEALASVEARRARGLARLDSARSILVRLAEPRGDGDVSSR